VNCYLHALADKEMPAVAICRNCGVALCLEHLEELQASRRGGMDMGCTHPKSPRAAVGR
jgi:hypothetical protein